jgi:hypothetical protein
MTPLRKPVRRRAAQCVRDAGHWREIVVTLYPSGLIGLRPAGTRREETLSIEAAYYGALKSRVLMEQIARRARHQRGKA